MLQKSHIRILDLSTIKYPQPPPIDQSHPRILNVGLPFATRLVNCYYLFLYIRIYNFSKHSQFMMSSYIKEIRAITCHSDSGTSA